MLFLLRLWLCALVKTGGLNADRGVIPCVAKGLARVGLWTSVGLFGGGHTRVFCGALRHLCSSLPALLQEEECSSDQGCSSVSSFVFWVPRSGGCLSVFAGFGWVISLVTWRRFLEPCASGDVLGLRFLSCCDISMMSQHCVKDPRCGSHC